jgi:hypothetical protein
MKKIFLLCLLFASPLFAQKDITVIVKDHDARVKSFPERPYGKDDLSYGLYLDIFDGMGGWRFGASYASGLTGFGEADTVITPEITLLGQDNVWITGISVMMDYIDDETGTDWGDVYFQIQLGLNFPIGKRFKAGIHAFFPFSDFGDFGDFAVGELDYGITLSASF